MKEKLREATKFVLIVIRVKFSKNSFANCSWKMCNEVNLKKGVVLANSFYYNENWRNLFHLYLPSFFFFKFVSIVRIIFTNLHILSNKSFKRIHVRSTRIQLCDLTFANVVSTFRNFTIFHRSIDRRRIEFPRFPSNDIVRASNAGHVIGTERRDRPIA